MAETTAKRKTRESVGKGCAKAGTGGAETLTFKHIFTHQNPGKIQDYYDFEKEVLGEGSFGSVKKATCKATGAVRAIKSINVSSIKPENKARFQQEIDIQQRLDHPHIVKLHEVFEDASKIYLALDLCTGGELFDAIVKAAGADGGGFDEKTAAEYMMQILGSMVYLHEQEYVHRDIKPENFLMTNDTPSAQIKVIDFGLAAHCPKGTNSLRTKAGTPYYVAPQVLQGQYNEKCDVWSCGVILYILLCGYPPFHGDTDQDILRRVKRGRFEFPAEDWGSVTAEAKDLIRKMLTMDPPARVSAADALEHTWITSKETNEGTVSPSLADRLKKFQSISGFKKIALTLIAQNMKDEDIAEMAATFDTLDKNKDGTLSHAEIVEGMQSHSLPIPEDFDAMLRQIDSDSSGKIDFSEFIAATLSHKQYMKREILWEAFRTFDTDGSGEITAAELKEVLNSSISDAEIAQLIHEVDTDQNGTVSFDEFCVMMDSRTKPKAMVAKTRRSAKLKDDDAGASEPAR